MLFFNTALNTSNSLDERLEIRADLIYAGIVPVIESLRRQCEDEFLGDEVT